MKMVHCGKKLDKGAKFEDWLHPSTMSMHLICLLDFLKIRKGQNVSLKEKKIHK